MIPQELYVVVSAVVVTGSIVWGFSSWISTRLTKVFDKLEKVQDAILDKLEYHERHDDQRFNQITNELVSIKIRNAARDGNPIPLKEST